MLHSDITLTMLAATRFNEESMNEILKLGPDLLKKDSIGRCALHFAARSGNTDALKSILVKYEDLDEEIDPTSNGGITPLMMAV